MVIQVALKERTSLYLRQIQVEVHNSIQKLISLSFCEKAKQLNLRCALRYRFF